jgi:hypothetical protein
MSEKFKIRFVWFHRKGWEHLFFIDLLSRLGFEVEVVYGSKEICDLEVVSVFKHRKDRVLNKIIDIASNRPHGELDAQRVYPYRYETLTSGATHRIWWSGENIRPPDTKYFKKTYSYDQDNFSGTNVYLPVWMMQAGFKDGRFEPRLGKEIKLESLLQPRILPKKKKFACAFIRNMQPTRGRVIDQLSKIAKVDVYGLATGQIVENKISVARDYRFMICFENDLYPGYVTEKPLESFMSETVPLYWGDMGSDTYINRNAIVNLKDFGSVESFVDYVASINADDYERIYKEPFLLTTPNFNLLARNLV